VGDNRQPILKTRLTALSMIAKMHVGYDFFRFTVLNRNKRQEKRKNEQTIGTP
jgi:hypothetical protein